jgi:hypothetical protein
MNTCSCGKLVDEKSTQCPRCAALQVFGLETDAAETEIRSAYRLLVRTWQPDRFQGDEKLKAAAEAKLKEITTAFEVLTSTSIQRGLPERPPHEAPYRAFQQAPPIPQPAPQAVPADMAAPAAMAAAVVLPSAIPPAPPPPQPFAPPLPQPFAPPRAQGWQKVKLFYKEAVSIYRKVRLMVRITAIALAILTGGTIWESHRAAAPGGGQAPTVADSFKMSAPGAPAVKKQTFIEWVEQQLRALGQRSSAPAAAPQTAQPAPQNAETSQAEKTRSAYRLTLPAPRNPDSRQPEKSGAAAHLAPPTSRHVLLPYITVGSTREEVLAQQGTPTASSEDKLVYGKSELYLKDGLVTGWRIDPFSSPMRVKLWPESPVDTGLDLFSYGSSKDAVLVVQGTPTAFTEDKFEYGGSVVYFQNNRVVSWKNDPASIPLRAR